MGLNALHILSPSISQVVWSRDSQKIAVCGVAHGIYIYTRNFDLIDCVQTYIEHVAALDWGPCDEIVYSQTATDETTQSAQIGRKLTLWDVKTNKPIDTLLADQNQFFADVLWSKDGNKIIAVLSDNSIVVWNAYTRKESIQLFGHSNYVRQLFELGSNQLASFGYDNTAKIWDIETGVMLFDSKIYKADIVHVDAARDGRYLLLVTAEGAFQIWDIANRVFERQPRLNKQKLQAAYLSFDNTYIIGVDLQGKVLVWHRTTGKIKRELNNLSPCHNNLAVHPNAQIVVLSLQNGTVMLWDIGRNHVDTLLENNPYPLRHLSWSPDGTRLIGWLMNSGIWLWEIGQEVKIITRPDENLVKLEGLMSSDLSPSKNHLLMGFERGQYGILDLKTSKTEMYSTSHREMLHSAKWNGTGSHYVLGGWFGSVDVIDAQTHVTQHHFKFEGTVENVDWHPSGSKIVGDFISGNSTIPGGAFVINLLTGDVDTFTGRGLTAAWNSDKTKYAVMQSQLEPNLVLYIHEISGEFSIHPLPIHIEDIEQIAWNDDGRYVCMAGRNGKLYIWDTEKDFLVSEIEAHSSSIRAIAWCPNSAILASGGSDHQLAVWDVFNQKLLHSVYHPSAVNTLTWSHDGEILIGASIYGAISLWEKSDQKTLSTRSL